MKGDSKKMGELRKSTSQLLIESALRQEQRAKQLMAEFIYNSGEDYCSVCCCQIYCGLKFEEDEHYEPKKDTCIEGILAYFEYKQASDGLNKPMKLPTNKSELKKFLR